MKSYIIWRVDRGWDMCYADPAQHIITAGEDLDDLDDLHRDLSDVSSILRFTS